MASALELLAGFRLVMAEGEVGDKGAVRNLLHHHMGQAEAVAVEEELVAGFLLVMMEVEVRDLLENHMG